MSYSEIVNRSIQFGAGYSYVCRLCLDKPELSRSCRASFTNLGPKFGTKGQKSGRTDIQGRLRSCSATKNGGW
jgi:hypothetical protein